MYINERRLNDLHKSLDYDKTPPHLVYVYNKAQNRNGHRTTQQSVKSDNLTNDERPPEVRLVKAEVV